MRPALGLLLVAALGCRRDDGTVRPLEVGDRVPTYSVRTLTGDTLRVGRGQPITLLNVWATWCAPCLAEFPDLERLANDYQSRGIRVLAVSVDAGSPAEVESFVREVKASFPIGLDPEGRVQDHFRTLALPESFLIGSNGRVLWRKMGALDSAGADARAAIERALNGST